MVCRKRKKHTRWEAFSQETVTGRRWTPSALAQKESANARRGRKVGPDDEQTTGQWAFYSCWAVLAFIIAILRQYLSILLILFLLLYFRSIEFLEDLEVNFSLSL